MMMSFHDDVVEPVVLGRELVVMMLGPPVAACHRAEHNRYGLDFLF